MMRVQRKFVEEVSGDEEGVEAEVDQEEAKKEELQVKNVFFLLFLSVQTGLMEMDINRTLTGSIRLALHTPNSTTFNR